MKRSVVGAFVSALVVIGLAPAASAATSSEVGVVKTVKGKTVKAKTVKGIKAPGGFSAQRIDWD